MPQSVAPASAKDNAGPRRPGAGRPTREQAVQRDAELLDLALELFIEKGFELTTIEAVAAAVGMTKRTVYTRYTDKTGLFRASVQRAIQRWKLPIETLRLLDTGDLESTLLAVARARVAHIMTPEGLRLQRIVNTQSYRFPEIFTLAYDQATRPLVDFVAELIRHHRAVGTVSCANPERAASAFMNLVFSGPARLIAIGTPLDEVEIEERISFAIGLFLDGIRTR